MIHKMYIALSKTNKIYWMASIQILDPQLCLRSLVAHGPCSSQFAE